MTSSDSTALRQYYRSVRANLANCPRKQRACILKTLKANISAFLEAEPEADFQKLQSHFGTPQQIASGYLNDLTDTELLGTVKKKKLWPVVVAFLAAVFTVWLLAIGWAIAKESEEDNGTVVTSPVIDVTP